eukprot:m.113449 g.113449  ORF g.113449 m.113449 type:complete len:443 (-) comp17083_c0_seq1:258-1586(-)
MWIRSVSSWLVITFAIIPLITKAQTNFDVIVATPPTQDEHQYQLQDVVSVLISAGNVFYDECPPCNNIPLQAFQITDGSGNPLGPFMQPTLDSENYFLDISPLVTGVGLYPFHRGLELTNASQRAWRLDYYKDGPSGDPYSTIMSGARQQLTTTQHRLTVDLQLRWSEEGDSLNRLGQGQFSHISLALADFNSFLFEITAPGAGRMTAELFTESPTATPTFSPSNNPTTPSPTGSPVSQAPTDPGVTPSPTTITTVTSTTTIDPEFRDQATDTTPSARQTDCGGKSGKSGKSGMSKSGSSSSGCIEDVEECEYEYDGKGKKKYKKGKKGKKCKKGKSPKKGKIGLSSFKNADTLGRSTVVAASAAVVVVFVAWVFVVQRQKTLDGYEPMHNNGPSEDAPPAPTTPTALAAFGHYKPMDLRAAAKSFHLPPSSSIRNGGESVS